MMEALNSIAATNRQLKTRKKNSEIICRDSRGALIKKGHIGASCVEGENPSTTTIAD